MTTNSITLNNVTKVQIEKADSSMPSSDSQWLDITVIDSDDNRTEITLWGVFISERPEVVEV